MTTPQKKSPAQRIVWHIGDQLNHKKYGTGIVTEVKGNIITVSFANPAAGVKKLMATVAPINKL